MKPLRFKSIRTRLLFWFLLLSLTPLAIGIIITFYQQKKEIEKQTFEKLIAIRDLKVQQLEDWTSERIADILTVSTDNELMVLEDILQKENKDQNDIKNINNINRILKRYLNNYSSYIELFIINPKTGIVFSSTNKNNEGINESGDICFTKPLEIRKTYISDIYYSDDLSMITMTISSPIFSSQHNNSQIIGILGAHVNLETSLYRLLLHRTGLGETGETLIVNSDGLALNELRWYQNAPLKLEISAEPATLDSHGETGITVSKDYRGEEILAAYTYIPQLGWGFVSKQDISELNKPIKTLLLNLILLLFISSLMIVIIVFWLINKIAKPIVNINEATKQIKDGDYSVHTIIDSNDELASLAESINEMTNSIRSRDITQQAVANISEIMIGQSTIQSFASELLKKLMEITKANMSTFYILNKGSSQYEHFASIGADVERLQPFSAENPEGEFGNALSQKSIYYLRNIPENTIFKYKTTAGEATPQEIITVPIIVGTKVVAIISLVNIHKFSNECYNILKQSWIAINTSYSSITASERTNILAEELSANNLKLEAQTEELQEQSEELMRTSDELQEQNIELIEQRKQVEVATNLKSDFLSNMSHELRTPLNSIMALSRVLIMQANEKLDDEENNYLEIIERNGKRLLSLINDILDLSKIESGKMEIAPEFMSIKSLLFSIKENMQTISSQKDVELTLSVADNLPRVETDEARLYQVFTNIISNAIKFTEKGSVDIEVNYNTENVIIDVKDTGIGISKDVLPHIFDEFKQADGSSSRQFDGTGLGLAIGKKMMEILGGNIDVKSKLGKGSVFTITLPINWHEPNKLKDPLDFAHVSQQETKDLVLVVDDDPKILDDICDYLEEAGYKSLTASSGEKALQLAEKYQPSAITLDIIMPDMDGWEVLQKLKDNPKTKNIPVIIISVSDEKDTGFALGAVGYVSKPIHENILLSEIYKLNKLPDKVMIVDNDDFELNQMSEIIESEKIVTILASTGDECLNLLENEIPDILVLDLMMPGIDGFEVLDKIRRNNETHDLPVIIVTAKNLTENDRSRLSGQISSIVAKSDTSQSELIKEVKRILNRLKRLRETNISEKDATKKQILIVEDNPEAIVQIKAVLEKENYLVDVANGGQQALDYIVHTLPDGIILDLMMPDIDGFDVLDKLRSTKITKNIPVLILTAKDLSSDDLAKLSANNIQQLINKGDVDIEGLLRRIKLMLQPATNRGIQREKKHEISQATKSASVGKSNKPTILVIEDNPDNMLAIRAILKNKFTILEAADGEKGLKIVISQQPDLILLDMSLPNIDGEEVVGILKTLEESKSIPVIAVTAQVMIGDKEKFMNKGCDGYVSKPIDQEKLLNEINRFLSTS